MSTSRPRVFLTAEWRWLAMLNYEIDPAVLAPYVPRGTELDTHEGRTFVSLVGFMFLRTSVLGVPAVCHRDFEEVNLRFYVRYPHSDGFRRGVVFIKEIVPKWTIATIARRVYGENYVALPMQHHIELTDGALSPGALVRYEWRFADRWQGLSVRVGEAPCAPLEGSQEQFITEHYWGYCRQGDGCTTEYEVEHPPWRLWSGNQAVLDCDVGRLYGDKFADSLAAEPYSAFVAEGSPVWVRRGNHI